MKKIAFLFLLVISSSAMGGFYKCKTGNGLIEYQSSPCVTGTDITPAAISNIKKSGKSYTGERISLNFNAIEVRALFELLATFSNKSLVMDSSIDRTISIHRIAIPWDQALDIAANKSNLNARVLDGRIYVEER